MLIKHNYILATSAVAKGVSYLSQCGDDQAMKNEILPLYNTCLAPLSLTTEHKFDD